MKCKGCGREMGIYLSRPPKSPFCDFCLNRKYGRSQDRPIMERCKATEQRGRQCELEEGHEEPHEITIRRGHGRSWWDPIE